MRYSPKGHGPALRWNRAVSAFLFEATMADGDRVVRPQGLENSRPQGGTIPLRSAAILMITLSQDSGTIVRHFTRAARKFVKPRLHLLDNG